MVQTIIHRLCYAER